MTASGFDRVRPRQPRTSAAGGVAHDAEGKRALFSSAGGSERPASGSVLVECSRCEARTVLSPGRALRVALPSLHLAVRIGHGDDVSIIGVASREYPTYLRCPACGRPSWVRYTVTV